MTKYEEKITCGTLTLHVLYQSSRFARNLTSLAETLPAFRCYCWRLTALAEPLQTFTSYCGTPALLAGPLTAFTSFFKTLTTRQDFYQPL